MDHYSRHKWTIIPAEEWTIIPDHFPSQAASWDEDWIEPPSGPVWLLSGTNIRLSDAFRQFVSKTVQVRFLFGLVAHCGSQNNAHVYCVGNRMHTQNSPAARVVTNTLSNAY